MIYIEPKIFFSAVTTDNYSVFSPAGSLSVTGRLTQLLGNSRVLLFIHQAKSNVLIIKIIQNLGCKLDRGAQKESRGSEGDKGLISAVVCL